MNPDEISPDDLGSVPAEARNCMCNFFAGTQLVECLMVKATCQWCLPFGHRNFCTNPSTRTGLLGQQG